MSQEELRRKFAARPFKPVVDTGAATGTDYGPLQPPVPGGQTAVVLGFELLARNVPTTATATAVQVLQDLADTIYEKRKSDDDCPFPVVAARAGSSNNNEQTACSAILRLHPDAFTIFKDPRPDLLEPWMELIHEACPDITLIPSPMSGGRDKKCWLSVHDAGEPAAADKLLAQIKSAIEARGYPLVTCYRPGKGQSLFFIFRTPDQVDKFLKAPLVIKPSTTPVKFNRSYQHDPAHLLEMAVTGCSRYGPSICEPLTRFFEHSPRDKDHPPGIEVVLQVRFLDNDVFCVTLREWKYTKRALEDTEQFQSLILSRYPDIVPPRLLYLVNDSPRARTVSAQLDGMAKGADAISKGLADRINAFERKLDAHISSSAINAQRVDSHLEKLAIATTQSLEAQRNIALRLESADAVSKARDQVSALMTAFATARVDLMVATEEQRPALNDQISILVAELAEARQLLKDREAEVNRTPMLVLPDFDAATVQTPPRKRQAIGPPTPASNVRPVRGAPSRSKSASVAAGLITPINFSSTQPSSSRLSGDEDTQMDNTPTL